jgi:hypothetical protein
MDESDKAITDNKFEYFMFEDPVISKLFKLNLDKIRANSDSAYRYSIISGERSSIVENKIINDKLYKKGIIYVEKVLKDRWLELEKILIDNKLVLENDLFYAVLYAIILKIRWKELENIFIPSTAHLEFEIMYTKDVIKGRWAQLEEKLLKNISNTTSVLYAIDYEIEVIKERWDKLEEKISSEEIENILLEQYDEGNFGVIYYTDIVKKDRWYELEEKLLNEKDPIGAILYQINVIKGDWTELEKKYNKKEIEEKLLDYIEELNKYTSFKNYSDLVNYAINIKKERWSSNIEEKIFNDVKSATIYQDYFQL